MTKFCKDCKHYIPYDLQGLAHLAKCAKVPLLTDEDYLVTGDLKYQYCNILRLTGGGCGQDGKWFEPKFEVAA